MEGRCLCGAVRVRLPEAVTTVDACHCGICRKQSSGGPMFALHAPGGARPEVEGEENLATYASSAWAERSFCRVCGTPVWYRFVEGAFYSLSAGLFDPAAFRFETEIFVEEKPGFYDFANETRKMTGAEVMAAFASDRAAGPETGA